MAKRIVCLVTHFADVGQRLLVTGSDDLEQDQFFRGKVHVQRGGVQADTRGAIPCRRAVVAAGGKAPDSRGELPAIHLAEARIPQLGCIVFERGCQPRPSAGARSPCVSTRTPSDDAASYGGRSRSR